MKRKNQWWHCQSCGAYFRSPVWKDECFRCGGDQPPPLSRNEIVAGVALAIMFATMFWAMGCTRQGKDRPLMIITEKASTYHDRLCMEPYMVGARRVDAEGFNEYEHIVRSEPLPVWCPF